MNGDERSFHLADLYEAVADACPDRTALVSDPAKADADPNRLTFAELDGRANRVAHALRAAGVRTGDHVAVLAHNRAEWLETALGCFKIRAAVINVNYRYVADELVHVLADSDAVALVGERELLAPLLRERDRLPQLRDVFVLEDGSTDEVAGAVGYEQALAAVSDSRHFEARSSDDHYLLYTGGTTGPPKGVVWRQEDIFFAAMGGGADAEGEPISRPDEIASRVPDEPVRCQVHAPLMHGGGQWVALRALTTGNTVVVRSGRRFDARAVLELAARERSHLLMIVGNGMAGPLTEALAAEPSAHDLSSLVALGSGGAPLSEGARTNLQRHLPELDIRDHLGVSETGAVGPASAEPDADGKTRFLPGGEFAVLDENFRPVPADSHQVGVLARRGHIPLAYYNDPERTAKTFVTDADGVRWALQGDHATWDADGTITFLGRSSQVINTGGEKVHAEEVETALRSHPEVDDAAVAGIADERYGERVAAVVTGSARTSSVELIDHCRPRLASYKIPRTIVFADELPRTAVGKPDHIAAATLIATARGKEAATPSRPKQLDSPLMPRLFRVMGKAQSWLYRRTGGRIGGKWRVGAGFRKPADVLLLEHRGRKSGTLFTAPLLYMTDGDDLVVVASQGGRSGHPQWYRNLLADPEAHVQLGAEHRPVRARTVEPAERARLWPLLLETYADFDTYQAWTERVIPLVILQPRPGA